MREWDRLIEQAVLTINLLRNSRLNPKRLACRFANGVQDFNAQPLAPPGIKLVAHEKSTHCNTWSIHGQDGYYAGPSHEHYCCIRAYIISTGGKHICDTVKFIPEKIPLPKTTTTDYLIQATSDIVSLLKNPIKLPLPQHNNLDLNDALKTTAELLQ